VEKTEGKQCKSEGFAVFAFFAVFTSSYIVVSLGEHDLPSDITAIIVHLYAFVWSLQFACDIIFEEMRLFPSARVQCRVISVAVEVCDGLVDRLF